MTSRGKVGLDTKHWRPMGRGVPAYRQIADSIERDVVTAVLPPGTRLPTQRELATQFGVTVATITRAYAIVRRRGLISTEVGRGTFVLGRASSAPRFDDRIVAAERFDLCGTPPLPIAPPDGMRLRRVLGELAESRQLDSILRGAAIAGTLEQRETAAAWLAANGVPAAAERVVLTAGVQHAINVAAASLLAPGDVVLCEERTYPGMKALARDFRLALVPIAMDEFGLDPDAIARACRRTRPRALYTIPTVHPATTAVLPHERRVAIAALARKYDLLLIEDDDDTALCSPRPVPLASLAPERTLYFGDLVKPLGVAIRIAVVAAPERLVARLIDGVRSTIYVTSPLDAEIACRLIANGGAVAGARARRKVAQIRQRLARSILPRFRGTPRAQTREGAHHVWLPLPSGVRDDVVAAELAARGVEVAAGSIFSVAARGAPALRVSLSGESDQGRLERALRRLAEELPAIAVP